MAAGCQRGSAQGRGTREQVAPSSTPSRVRRRRRARRLLQRPLRPYAGLSWACDCARRRPRGPLQQELGDLERVERGALDEVVAGEEEDESVAPAWSGRIRPTSTSSLCAAARGLASRRDGRSERLTAASPPAPARAVPRIDPDGLGMADEDGYAYGCRAERQVGQLEDLARLGADLRLLPRSRRPPRSSRTRGRAPRRLGPQLLHP